jgi:diaminohydroxyphosphoribosylaminopyrimidine deaminase / 5-amino-6-(5-phosphoribosylamino)uracil reductase
MHRSPVTGHRSRLLLVFSADDKRHMARALELAERGLYTTTPNPRVGCVIVRGGEVAGEGWHEKAGGPHAEVNALQAAGARARGSTVYVTLEPCAHHGRTPPCVDALLAAGVARVVAAMKDPYLHAGDGLALLEQRGVAVASGLLENEARELNVGFVARLTRGRPWVRMKIAASLDGKTALRHHWRARACAVVTGIGTVLDDDPQLTVREVATTRQPLRVVIDSRLETPLTGRVLAGGNVLVAAAREHRDRIAALREKGAEVIVLPNAAGKVELPELFRELARRDLNEVHVEAGHKLNGSLLNEGMVDELVLYLAPHVIGDAASGMFNLPELTDLSGRRRAIIRDVRMVGDDVRLLARFMQDGTADERR